MKLLLECKNETDRLSSFKFHTYKSLQDVWTKIKIRSKKIKSKRAIEKRRETTILPEESYIDPEWHPAMPDYSFWRESMNDWDEPLVFDLSHFKIIGEKERDRSTQSIKITLSHLTYCPHPAKLYLTGNDNCILTIYLTRQSDN